MAWRAQGITGSNNIPLGNRRRFGGDEPQVKTEPDGYSNYKAAQFEPQKRGRSPERGKQFSTLTD